MYKVKFSVRYADLEKMELFPSHVSLDKFLKFYSRFDFNEPEFISKYGVKPRSLEDAVASQVVVLNDSINTSSLVTRQRSGQTPERTRACSLHFSVCN